MRLRKVELSENLIYLYNVYLCKDKTRWINADFN